VIGVGYDKDGKELLRDTVTITQLRPILQASPNPVTFEQKGGTVKVTLNTTLAQIEAQIQEGGNLDKFFTMTLNADNTITVTAPENTTGQELSGNIIVKGTSPGGQKAELNLNVIQKGEEKEEGNDYSLSVSPNSATIDAKGGSIRITVNDVYPKDDGNDVLLDVNTDYSSDRGWISLSWDQGDYIVTATENTTGKERTATLTFILSIAKKGIEIKKSVTVTQLGTETANILSNYDFTVFLKVAAEAEKHSEDPNRGWFSALFASFNPVEISDVTHHADGTTTIKYEDQTPVKENKWSESRKLELKLKVDDNGQMVVLGGSAEASSTYDYEDPEYGYDVGYYNITIPQITSINIRSYMDGDNLTTGFDHYDAHFESEIPFEGSGYEVYHKNSSKYDQERINGKRFYGSLSISLSKKK
jgi:hypothetical protein